MREARGVEHHLLDGDDVLAVRGELWDVLDDELGRVDESLADQRPDRRGDERLRGRERGVSRVEIRVAVGLERDQLALVRERHLCGRQKPFVHLTPGAGQQCINLALIDPHGAEDTLRP